MEKEKPSVVSLGVWTLLSGVLGLVSSLVLLYERMQLDADPDHVVSCDVNQWVACGSVMESWQSTALVVPNIYIGVVGFSAVLGVAAALLWRRTYPPVWFMAALQLGSTFAFGYIVWLWYQSVFNIGALCPYCMMVWVSATLLWFKTISWSAGVGLLGPARLSRETADSWWWVGAVPVLLGFTASIILVFPGLLSG